MQRFARLRPQLIQQLAGPVIIETMTQPLYRLDTHDHAIMARGWALLAALAVQLAQWLGASEGGLHLSRHRLFGLVRVGEAMARRLLVMAALCLPRPMARTPRPMTQDQKRALKALAKSPSDKIVRFALAEPLAAYRIVGPPGPRYTGPDQGPRIRSFYDDPFAVTRALLASPTAPEPEPEPGPDPLLRRLDALQHVVDHKHRHARRMARWMAHQAQHRYGRSSPLRPGRAPGQVKAVRSRSREQACLADLDGNVRRAVAIVRRSLATGPPDSVGKTAPC